MQSTLCVCAVHNFLVT